jgi:sugar (pentulose or hexulose) kinase
MKFVSIDVGTSSVKAALIDGDLNILSTSKRDYQIRTINVDWVELDADVILNAVIEAIKHLHGSREADMVVFDNFSPTPMLMDREGDALYPIITHLDRRSKKQTRYILEKLGHDHFQAITGIQPFTGGASITSILWLKENEPEKFKSCFRIGHVGTYLYKKLTGKWAIDSVNASMTGMYETLTGEGWSEEICGIFGIPADILPDVLPSGAEAAPLVKEIAILIGLRDGVLVVLGTNDATAAHIGADNGAPGDVLNICGSSDMVSILTSIPVVDDRYYLRRFCLPGLWQIFATTAGGFAVEWCRDQFYRDMENRDFYDNEFELAAAICNEDMTVDFTPYLTGDRQSIEPKKASLSGLTLETTRRSILSAIFLGMHKPMREIIDICEKKIVLNKKIKLTGGMLSPAFVDLKKRLFPSYDFDVLDNCPLVGNVALALKFNG